MREGKIPYIKPARVGNFKLWRSRFQMSVRTEESGKKEKVDVICVNVSDLEGTWKVQIPSTFEMYAVLTSLYGDLCSDDTSLRDKAQSAILHILSNMMYASVVGNGFYHQALMYVNTAYADPNILNKRDKRHKDIKKSFTELISEYREWRKTLAENIVEPTEDESRKDVIADQAAQILTSE